MTDRRDIPCLGFLALIAGVFSILPPFFHATLNVTLMPLALLACLFPIYVKRIKQKQLKGREQNE